MSFINKNLSATENSPEVGRTDPNTSPLVEMRVQIFQVSLGRSGVSDLDKLNPDLRSILSFVDPGTELRIYLPETGGISRRLTSWRLR